MASKYDSWDGFFEGLEGDEVFFTFDEIENLTRVMLPPSARSQEPWWSNATYWAHWAKHGWYASPRIAEGGVRFVKGPLRSGRPSRRQSSPNDLESASPTKRASRSLPELGRMVLVGCVASKAGEAMPAKDLYVSALWHKRRSYAEGTGMPWFILSAKYGLLHPDRVIEPYDVSLADAAAAESRAWAQSVAPKLVELCSALGVTSIEVHAGQAYIPPELTRVLEGSSISIDRPLEGMRIGEQLSWYTGSSLIGETEPPVGPSLPAPPAAPSVDLSSLMRSSLTETRMVPALPKQRCFYPTIWERIAS